MFFRDLQAHVVVFAHHQMGVCTRCFPSALDGSGNAGRWSVTGESQTLAFPEGRTPGTQFSPLSLALNSINNNI